MERKILCGERERESQEGYATTEEPTGFRSPLPPLSTGLQRRQRRQNCVVRVCDSFPQRPTPSFLPCRDLIAVWYRIRTVLHTFISIYIYIYMYTYAHMCRFWSVFNGPEEEESGCIRRLYSIQSRKRVHTGSLLGSSWLLPKGGNKKNKLSDIWSIRMLGCRRSSIYIVLAEERERERENHCWQIPDGRLETFATRGVSETVSLCCSRGRGYIAMWNVTVWLANSTFGAHSVPFSTGNTETSQTNVCLRISIGRIETAAGCRLTVKAGHVQRLPLNEAVTLVQLADQQLATAEKMDQMVLVQRNSSGDITARFNDAN